MVIKYVRGGVYFLKIDFFLMVPLFGAFLCTPIFVSCGAIFFMPPLRIIFGFFFVAPHLLHPLTYFMTIFPFSRYYLNGKPIPQKFSPHPF